MLGALEVVRAAYCTL